MKRNHFAIRKVILILFVYLMPISILAQKVNLDTLTIDELNMYKDQAVRTRNIGIGMTFGGIGVVAVGFIVPYAIASYTGDDAPWYIAGFAGAVGLVSTAIGIPLWTKGAKRKAEAELKLQTFSIVPENSMAVGLGITIRF